jgi:transposase-like protein
MTHAPDLTRRPRTRKVFSDKDIERMAALYYDPAVPVQKVADAFDVPVSTFLRWISEMGWPRRRERRGFRSS